VNQDTDLDAREAEASARLASMFDASMIDALVADAMASGSPTWGVDGVVNQMTKAVLERALEAEMTHELGYERGESGRSGFGQFSSWPFIHDGFDVERGR
jgi:putative transposase